MLTISFLTAQAAGNFWKDVSKDQIWLPEKSEQDALPLKYRSLSLDLNSLKNYLAAAPMENSAAAKTKTLTVELPMPDGTTEAFAVVESPVMAPKLAARYPMIKSFLGRGIQHPDHTLRFDYGLQGFNGIIHAGENSILITPYATNQLRYYNSYFAKDLDMEGLDLPRGNDLLYDPAAARKLPENAQNPNAGLLKSNKVELRTYGFALATTGEYSQNHGGTTPSVLSTLNTATNVINSVLERDAAIRLVLIENIELIIFLDSATDPYVNANMGGALLGQNQAVLNSVVGFDNYGWGHLLTAGCVDVGGVVGGAICGAGKGRGVTCHATNNVEAITLRIGAHEMAHQITGGHTFSSCPGSEGQLNLSTAFEPGSGSTLLSYAGICGDQNIVTNSNPYYHGGNIGRFFQYTRMGNGNTCATVEITDNDEPVLELPYEDGFYIPISTPFALTAIGSDEDATDVLNYNWEEINTGTAPLGMPFLEAPLFRSWPPTASPTRLLPRLPMLLNNGSEVVEILPDYSRNITFRCTLRDNYPGAGGVVFKDISFEATASAGPFLVTQPNVDTVIWEAGSFQEVTWDVANTTNNKVNCQFVNIKLSVDGGVNFPMTLLSHTPNDGSEIVQVPNAESPAVRVKVEAADNIFFDISNKNFTIAPPASPGFTLNISNQYQQVCVPGMAQVELTTDTLLGFDSLVTFEILEGLPGDVGIAFSANPVTAGESSTLSLDMSNVTEDGVFDVVLRAVAPGADTVLQTLIFSIVNNDFSALQLLEPANGVSDIGFLTDFSWTDLPNADFYDFELSTDPTFAAEFILDSASGLTEGNYTPVVSLAENELYFWRVRPSNECGTDEYTAPFAFHTFTVACSPFSSSDIPVTIPSAGTPTVTSELTILDNGVINDLNVTKVKGFHDAVPDIEIRLASPEGTKVVLMSAQCGNTSLFDIGFDDEAPFEIQCPPIGGNSVIPAEPLAAFNGESTFGIWTLEVEVLDNIGAGGALEAWGVEFCASVTPNNPFLVTNDSLFVPPNESRGITQNMLEVTDDDNNADELTFTVVTATAEGTLLLNDSPIDVGDSFLQSDINSGSLRYENDNPDAQTDFFTFTVEDGTGGWLGTPQFNIKIMEGEPVATFEIDTENDINLYPNPAGDFLNIAIKKQIQGSLTIAIFDIHGRHLNKQDYNNAQGDVEINTAGLASGVYFLRFQTERGVFSRKFIVQK